MPDNTDISTTYTPTQQIDDLIGVAPTWLLKSGITVVAIVTAVILAMSAIIKYPDKIVAKGIMTSENPPIEHVNQVAGIIEEIYVENGKTVIENEPLIYIKNNVNRNDLTALQAFMQHYESIRHIPNYLKLKYPQNLELGELQSTYTQLQLSFSQFQLTLKQSNVFQQIKTLENEIQNTKELRKVMMSEKIYSKDEMDLIERDFSRNVYLNKEGVVSNLDKEKAEGEWLRYQKQYNNLDQGIIQNKIREEQLMLETLKLAEERASAVQNQLHNIAQHINLLESAIQEWDSKYLIRAEIAGELALTPNLAKNKYINQNTVMLSVIPSETKNQKLIRVQTTSEGIGKIGLNDKVIIKIDGYPYKEFGIIISQLQEISPLPEITQTRDGTTQYMYSININLPDTLLTNHHMVLPYHPNSSVTAEIIAKEKTVLERLLQTFISLIRSE